MVIKSQKGSTLVLVLLIGFLGTVIGTTLYTVSSANATQVQERTNRLQADYYAESGVNLALGIISSDDHKNAKGECEYLFNVPGHSKEYWGTLEEGLTDKEPSHEKYTIDVIITYFEATSEYDAYYRIESKGYVRGSGASTAQSASQAQYKITVQALNDANGNDTTDPGEDPTNPGNDPSKPTPALDKIFAVGTNPSSKKAISLQRNLLEIQPFIYGYTAMNSGSKESIDSDYNLLVNKKNIYGKLYVGPNESFKPAVFAPYVSYLSLYPSDYIKELGEKRSFPLPDFPNFPFNDAEKSSDLTISNNTTIESGQYKYNTITVKKDKILTINVSDQDTILQTENLDVEGKIIIKQNGKGKAKIFVTNEFKLNSKSGDFFSGLLKKISLPKITIPNDTLTTNFLNGLDRFYSSNLTDNSARINAFGNSDCLELYYSGTNKLVFNEDTMFFGSVYAKTADVKMCDKCLITGTIISGGSSVVLEEYARLIIYAPNASFECKSNAIVGGRVVVRDIKLNGYCGIVYSKSIDTNFFNRLGWSQLDSSDINVEEIDEEEISTVNNIIQAGSWEQS